MDGLLSYPSVIFTISVVLLWTSVRLGVSAVTRWPVKEKEREALRVVFSATLTVLGLVIGFSFSMAVNHHDQRKNAEAAEANAIGTEYLRAELLPTTTADQEKDLLRRYLEERIVFYEEGHERNVPQIDRETAQLQGEMWTTVQSVAATSPTPMIVLAVAGMNEVLNSQAYTQAAWWMRIPEPGWLLMAMIAFCCCVLMGASAHEARTGLLASLPVVLSIAFFLIAEIDSPRRGAVRVRPRNLTRLALSLHSVVPPGRHSL
jgi:hypothetical protein